MASKLILTLLILLTTTTTTTTTTKPRNSTTPNNHHQILDALIGSGDFSNWANILSSTDPSILPATATIFIPSDTDYAAIEAANAAHLTPFLLFPYHVIPQKLTFNDLLKYPTHTRLPTLLPGFSLIVTDNSRGNFSIDGCLITQPDLYQNPAVSAHGISSPFDYTVFGAFDYTAVFGNKTDDNNQSREGNHTNHSNGGGICLFPWCWFWLWCFLGYFLLFLRWV